MDLVKLDKTIRKMRQVDKNSTYVCAWDLDNSLVSNDEIEKIESILGFSLCDDYKKYLKTWGHIITLDLVVTGMFLDNGRVATPFFESTQSFFDKYFGGNSDGCTVIGISEDQEWFYILEHKSSLVTPFDPFAKKYVENLAKPFEKFLHDELADILDILEE